MDSRLIFILNKYKSELKDYNYINYDDLKNIDPKTKLKYISIYNLCIKNGYLRKYIDPGILELYINSKKIWYIYINKYYFFYKISKNEKIRDTLKSLVETDFKILKKFNKD